MSSREVKKGMKNSPEGEQQEELKKKKKFEKYYKDGRIVYKEDRLITSRCNVSNGSFTFHFLLDLRFSSFLFSARIYIFFPLDDICPREKKSSFFNVEQSSFNEFSDRISRRRGGRKKREEKRRRERER